MSEEKKEVQANLKQNRSIVSIYEELQKYMQKAYLYDAFGRTEYMEDFKKYKELSERLETIYGKSDEECRSICYRSEESASLCKSFKDEELKKQYALIRNAIWRREVLKLMRMYFPFIRQWDMGKQAEMQESMGFLLVM
ncbi:MAG: hypothetical protein ACLT1J_00970 [Mediterraneibacter gnavus]